MNNEPVAWMWYQSKENTNPYTQMTGYSYLCFSEFKPDENVKVDEGTLTPLYTHPVNPKYDPETGEPLIDGYPLFSGLPNPVKELTDEEIEECYCDTIYQGEFDRNVFAKAILRKAQEK